MTATGSPGTKGFPEDKISHHLWKTFGSWKPSASNDDNSPWAVSHIKSVLHMDKSLNKDRKEMR